MVPCDRAVRRGPSRGTGPARLHRRRPPADDADERLRRAVGGGSGRRRSRPRRSPQRFRRARALGPGPRRAGDARRRRPARATGSPRRADLHFPLALDHGLRRLRLRADRRQRQAAAGPGGARAGARRVAGGGRPGRGRYPARKGVRAKCCGCTKAFQAFRAGSIPVARFHSHGEWRSLVAHPAGGRAVAGSNPVSPTPESPAYAGLFGSR